MRSRWFAGAVMLALAACLAACDADADRADEAPRSSGIGVASFDFAESRLLAEIYAQALEAEGFDVARQLDLGPRELIVPALRQGFVDVVPEYAGSALDAISPGSTADQHDLAEVLDALGVAVRPWGLEPLAPASASNQNALAVTAAAATDGRFSTISDLRAIAASSTIGGPPECAVRQRCLLGFADVYGLEFAAFVPLADADLVRRALVDGVIDVGVLFSTDAALADDTLVVLRDDRGLQPADNIVPLVRRSALDERAVSVLGEVSARLTTTNLRFLNWRVANADTDEASEARGWLVRQGLVPR